MESDQEGNAEADTAASALPVRTASILVVDDDAAVREILVELLTDSGHRVRVAAGGAEALRILAEARGGVPGEVSEVELVISDVQMPEMSGFELADRLATGHPGIKVILISGYYVSHDVGWRVLRKPFRMQELESAVQAELTG